MLGMRDDQPFARPETGGEEAGGDAAHGVVELGKGPALGRLRRIDIGDEDQPGLAGVARGTAAQAVRAMLNHAGGGSGEDDGASLFMNLQAKGEWELAGQGRCAAAVADRRRTPHPLIPAQAGIQFFQRHTEAW